MTAFRTFAASVLVLAPTIAVPAQDATRHLWDTAFLAPQAGKTATGQAAHKPRYKVLTPEIPFENVDPSTVVGITVWKLHAYRKGDGGERILTHDGPRPVALQPKRVSARTLFRTNDKVRISIEVAREGYIYIVDRERFGNGRQGDPYLIFPATGIRGGENRVVPGQIVEIPAQSDDLPYFKMGRSRPDQIGEQLTVLVTPTPVKDIVPAEKEQRLSWEQWTRLEHAPHADTGMAEMADNPALDWSREERNAGRDPAFRLAASAPLPQTLFYSPAARPEAPTVVTLMLNYAPQARPRE